MANFQPYDDAPTNTLYNLLFCDDLDVLRKNSAEISPGLMRLFDSALDEKAVRTIAENTTMHPRLRALAFHRLREGKKKTPTKVLLGAIAEIPMDEKPETFATYADGSIRYINTRGQVSFVDGNVPPLAQATQRVIAAAGDLADTTRPSGKDRQKLPGDRARLTVLMSDGPYVVEGPMDKLMKDKRANAFIEASGQLLKLFVDVMMDQAAKKMAKEAAKGQTQQ